MSDKPLFNSECELKEIAIKILDSNPQLAIDFHNGDNRVVARIVRKMMKITKGKVDSSLLSVIVNEELLRR